MTFSEHLPAQPAFNHNCEAFPGKRVVLVATNLEYWDIFENWYNHATQFMTKDDQLVVAAESPEVIERLEKHSFSYIDGNDVLHHGNARHEIGNALVHEDSRPPYGSRGFNKLTGKRPRHILGLLQMKCTVFYSDIDLVWTTNVYAGMAAAGPQIMYLMSDDREPTPAGQWSKQYCSCFLYMQPMKANVKLTTDWLRLVNDEDNDQPAFTNALHLIYPTPPSALPYKEFPPGIQADKCHETRRIIHANWLVGKDAKVDFLKQHGLWNTTSTW